MAFSITPTLHHSILLVGGAMKKTIAFTINGEETTLVVDTRQTLLDVLRDNLHLTGTKEGCGNGNCGACAVLLDGAAVDSCLVLACEADGREVVTVEGIAQDGQLHPLQKRFVEIGGLECGFCTPGMMVSSYALLKQNANPTEEDIRLALAGNLCRCTGYDKIVRAVQAAAEDVRVR
jgi:carbon-monoxide dehydrogenase small subunit